MNGWRSSSHSNDVSVRLLASEELDIPGGGLTALRNAQAQAEDPGSLSEAIGRPPG
jgi:hypothetical protein